MAPGVLQNQLAGKGAIFVIHVLRLSIDFPMFIGTFIAVHSLRILDTHQFSLVCLDFHIRALFDSYRC